MPRLMSVSLTEDAVREGTKTVTRRLGWWTDRNGRRLLYAGDRLTLCRKVMGRAPGEPLERIRDVEVLSVCRVQLCSIDEADIEREAVPVLPGRFSEVFTDTGQPTPDAWVEWFCEEQRCHPLDYVTRIEWRYT